MTIRLMMCAAGVALGIACSYGHALLGDWKSVWFWCQTGGLC
jgi:hypothetical protein